MFDIISIPAIVIICYLIGAGLKAINNKPVEKFIPIICGFVGGIFGVVAFVTIPGFIPAENWIVAAAVGIVSGFSATGINQIYKQMTKA